MTVVLQQPAIISAGKWPDACPACGAVKSCRFFDGRMNCLLCKTAFIFERPEGRLGPQPSLQPGEAKKLALEAIKQSRCPDCGRVMDLQFRNPRRWWCATCRLWVDEAELVSLLEGRGNDYQEAATEGGRQANSPAHDESGK